MKNNYSLMIVILSIFCSCNTDLAKWESTTSRIQFLGDTLVSKSFIFENETMTRDTVYLTLRTMGFASNSDRYFTLQQVELEGVKNAVAGVHYLGFDDPEMKKHLKVAANEATVSVPIIVLRDRSLLEGRVELKIALVEDDEFLFGEVNTFYRRLVISDEYERPASYNSSIENTFGTYSKVKHKFIHQVLWEKSGIIPDDAFFKRVYSNGTYKYYSEVCGRALKIYNEDPNNPDTPLTSEPLLPNFPNGQVIEFKW